jgi:hypothetical protein
MNEKNFSEEMFTQLNNEIKLEEDIIELVRSRTAEIHGSGKLAASNGKAGQTQPLNFIVPENLNEKAAIALTVTDAITLNSIDSFLEMILQHAQKHFTRGEVICLVLTVLASNDFYYQAGLCGQSARFPGF